MNQEDKSVFSVLITNLSKIYNVSISSKIIDMYWLLLKSYEISEIKAACYIEINNRYKMQNMPNPAEIKRILDKNNTSILKKLSEVNDG